MWVRVLLPERGRSSVAECNRAKVEVVGSSPTARSKIAVVAQWPEQRTRKAQVVGSTPTRSSIW